MTFEHYIRSGQKLLRCGYTTGTCAALAVQGAVTLLLSGRIPRTLKLVTPGGLTVEVTPRSCYLTDGGTAVCSVEKDGGDDADVTDGMEIVAAVNCVGRAGVVIDGGPGVGRVTKPGLDQPVGAAAINSVPRRMIREQALGVCRACGYTGGLKIVISVPRGAEAARLTFNPNLGVEGGISILGTSGIVEPMSRQALIDTIELELGQAAEASDRLILTPGNYGLDFLKSQGWNRLGVPVVKCSNFIGDALDIAAGLPFAEVLLAGHIGKLVKLAGGVMNTHSRNADCRREIFCAHAAVCGADAGLCRALMEAATADACIELLDRSGLRRPVMEGILAAVQRSLDHRAAGAYQIGAVLFSSRFGCLGATEDAETLLRKWRKQQK